MFYLALTFGLESDPVAAVERMVGFVEEAGRGHGVEHPIQMTIAATDGRSVYAFRHSSEGESRSLYFSTRMDALKAFHSESEELAALSDETGVVDRTAQERAPANAEHTPSAESVPLPNLWKPRASPSTRTRTRLRPLRLSNG